MGRTIRPEVSEKRDYWLSKERYLELVHFCLQYNEWKREKNSLTGFSGKPFQDGEGHSVGSFYDVTGNTAEKVIFYEDRMALVEKSARLTDPVIGSYIFIGVTEGVTYENLRLLHGIPCCRTEYYQLYHKFFWILSRLRL